MFVQKQIKQLNINFVRIFSLDFLKKYLRQFFLRMFFKCQFSKTLIVWKSYEKIILTNFYILVWLEHELSSLILSASEF